MHGYELELTVLLAIVIVGNGVFAVFEGETAPWRKILKWSIVCGATLLAARTIGHLALLIPAAIGMLGLGFHAYWCRTNGIHPFNATPRRRYYELRGWRWPE